MRTNTIYTQGNMPGENAIQNLLQDYEDKNLLVFSYLKAFKEFLEEENNGGHFAEDALIKKIKAARLLFK